MGMSLFGDCFEEISYFRGTKSPSTAELTGLQRGTGYVRLHVFWSLRFAIGRLLTMLLADSELPKIVPLEVGTDPTCVN